VDEGGMGAFEAAAGEFEPAGTGSRLRVVQPAVAEDVTADATILEFGHAHGSAAEVGSLIYAW